MVNNSDNSTISLSDVINGQLKDKIGNGGAEEVQKLLSAHATLSDVDLKNRVADDVMKLFKWSIAATLFLVFILVGVDFIQLRAFGVRSGYDPLITSNVVMALIGASVVQVGAALATIVAYMFPKS